MKYIKHILFFSFVITLFFSCNKKQDSYTIHVSGKVLDAVTNLPVAGAEIRKPNTTNPSDIIAQTDLNGNYSFQFQNEPENNEFLFYFEISNIGYGGYIGSEIFQVPGEINLENHNLIIHPNTYMSLIATKTTITDSAIRVLYLEPNWAQPAHGIYIYNSSSPDTLTIIALAGMINHISLIVDRYNSNPPVISYLQSNFGYNIDCPSLDTTYYSLNY